MLLDEEDEDDDDEDEDEADDVDEVDLGGGATRSDECCGLLLVEIFIAVDGPVVVVVAVVVDPSPVDRVGVVLKPA